MDPELKQEIEILHEQVCAALADPTRLILFYVLARGPICVNDIAAELGIPQSTVSRHLKVLRDRSLVETDRQANSVYYSLADERIIQALDLLRGILRDRVLRQATVVKNRDIEEAPVSRAGNGSQQ